MQKQQVFKVKGMQRDASMANANGEFAYEILNMRLMPAEDLSGFSLTNEKGTTQVITGIHGQVIGQCPTNDSLVVFITDATYNENNEREGGDDYIYEIYQDDEGNWTLNPLYTGNLNFHADKHIEALFNYETEDIQKVYWIDGINQLRCINLVGEIQTDNNQQFDSVKEINSLPSVEIERVVGGSFTAGVIQYYITYFNKNSSESPIVYTSPLLYIAHDNRGANVNDQVSTAFKLTFADLDTTNWEYMRIYATHRTSIDATPEASIVTELNMNNSTIEFTDYGSNRTSIAPTDLYFTGGKFVKAGTMTVKDQVMFLGNLNIETPETVPVVEIQHLFESIRGNEEDHPFTTTTRKTKENKLEEYEDTHYYYKNQLNNTEPITHYKYGEKYRFGISVLDKYGNWSNPIWIKDAFIEVPPEQVDSNTLKLPCPSLNLYHNITYNDETKTLLDHLQDRGVIGIKPIVVFPKEDERKVIAQGVVCPTVYNLKDRKENGPYAQASWFMRPNAPVDLWGIQKLPTGISVSAINQRVLGIQSQAEIKTIENIWHYSDLMAAEETVPTEDNVSDIRDFFGYFGAASENWNVLNVQTFSQDIPKPYQYMMDDGNYKSWGKAPDTITNIDSYYDLYYNRGTYWEKSYLGNDQYSIYSFDSVEDFEKEVIQKGSWVEFRHNYALRSKGWSFGSPSSSTRKATYADSSIRYLRHGQPFGYGINDYMYAEQQDSHIFGNYRVSELGNTRYFYMLPVNRLFNGQDGKKYFRYLNQENMDIENNFMTGNSAYYIDASIVTLNSPEIELDHSRKSYSFDNNVNFRIIGIIPLTATISDSSLTVTKPAPNDEQYPDVGYKVIHLENKNIGHHGFKGIVASNSYFSNPKDPNTGYQTVLLNPWQPTGTIQSVQADAEGVGEYELLEKKILSNLRYSASSYYFSSDNFNIRTDLGDPEQITGTEEMSNFAKLGISSSKIIGWKPANGSIISLFDFNDDRIIRITKEFESKDLVYQGNINSLATAYNGNNNPLEIANAVVVKHDSTSQTESKYNFPIFNLYNSHLFKSRSDSIKYKSSPHVVAAFKEFNSSDLWDSTTKKAQEILPSFYLVNSVGLPATSKYTMRETDNIEYLLGELYENSDICSVPHQSQITIPNQTNFGLPGYSSYMYSQIGGGFIPTYGWLWLGEVYRETDPTFGGTSDYALQNNQWENAGNSQIIVNTLEIEPYYEIGLAGSKRSTWVLEGKAGGRIEYSSVLKGCRIDINNPTQTGGFEGIKVVSNSSVSSDSDPFGITGVEYNFCIIKNSTLYNRILIYLNQLQNRPNSTLEISFAENILSSGIIAFEDKPLIVYEQADTTGGTPISKMTQLILTGTNNNGTVKCSMSIICSETAINISYTVHDIIDTTDNPLTFSGTATTPEILRWTSGDTYYQRFDTLKTYAYSDSDQNSVIDITSFMVETRINIDGRTDRNRGQESNLQMSPTNFNLMNDVYSQRDNFFTYRILDEDLQARTNFPNQITWSLTKTAGATVDAWMNITLASVLDLDGTKGKISALKNFNNNIIAFQEKGLSHIMFNSRAQIATSEAVPIQIANTGKVDGQQYFTTDVGCQDKWNIVTTPNGLYFVDYFNKSIYRFNGQLEDISTPNGFRSWCYENLNSTANIIGYYDVKNKEVMYYIGDTRFKLDNDLKPTWLGFSELTGAFSSFYTYPKAWFANVQDQGLWIVSEDNTNVYTHQTGNYNELLNTDKSFYGLTVIPRQDSNTIKTFNNVEFRADSYNGSTLDNNNTFDTISAETEYQTRTSNPLTYSQYRPSNLKKKFRTWRANIPRVNNGYNRFVNQWAKIGLWKMNPGTEKTILHDLSVWYSE